MEWIRCIAISYGKLHIDYIESNINDYIGDSNYKILGSYQMEDNDTRYVYLLNTKPLTISHHKYCKYRCMQSFIMEINDDCGNSNMIHIIKIVDEKLVDLAVDDIVIISLLKINKSLHIVGRYM